MSAPSDPNDIADPTLAALAMLKAEKADPIEPIDATLPTDRIDSVEPRLAIDRNESSDATDHRDGMVPGWPRHAPPATAPGHQPCVPGPPLNGPTTRDVIQPP